ncbi:MAG: LLM class F420-dependent oxidoreductase [Caulobacteraceae bacterium]|nr:LLM class F420-dependent oxidoreductase [Caulobacteraceae bacterium]
MRTSFFLPHEGEFWSGEAVKAIAVQAEALGFDGLAVSEHPVPGTDTFAFGGHNQADPFVTLAIAAAVTQRLKLQTHVIVLPYRNPFLTAKSIATLDCMSGGRVNMGVGAGYGQAEFKALGVDFEERNELTDEAIAAMKQVWTGEEIAFKGRHFEAEGVMAAPRPAQRPHPPIWVGGNSKRAIRRAIELGDGWLPFGNPPDVAADRRSSMIWSPEDLKRGVDFLQSAADAAGRTAPIEVIFAPYTTATSSRCPDPAETIDVTSKLKEAGMTYCSCAIVGPRTEDNLAAFLANMEWMAKTILPGFEAL